MADRIDGEKQMGTRVVLRIGKKNADTETARVVLEYDDVTQGIGGLVHVSRPDYLVPIAQELGLRPRATIDVDEDGKEWGDDL
ncbi:hypothetical protein [Rhodococcus pyridinivorans]|uniref:hypothetical protein n=1 Tax=Rhodococcus pyridinivorans TaxID=103816 RepID=UPI003AADDB33